MTAESVYSQIRIFTFLKISLSNNTYDGKFANSAIQLAIWF